MPNASEPNKPTPPSSTALKLQVVRQGRRVAGRGKRSQAPTPFLHLHPANKLARENVAPAAPQTEAKPDA